MAQEGTLLGKGFSNPRYKVLIECLIVERKRQRLSQEAFAARLGRPQQFVSRYELGERRLDIVEFVDIARTLGMEPASLIGTVDEA